MRGGPSALGHCLLALLQVLPSPWNTWSQDSRHNTAQSFFTAALKKKLLLHKTTSLSEEVMQRLKSITVMDWTQQKQIADTKANTGNVWLHSKLVGFLFHRSACDSIIFYAFLRVSYLLPSILHSFSEQKDLFNFLNLFLAFIDSPLEFPGPASPVFLLAWCLERFSPVCCWKDTCNSCIPSLTVCRRSVVPASLDTCNNKSITLRKMDEIRLKKFVWLPLIMLIPCLCLLNI